MISDKRDIVKKSFNLEMNLLLHLYLVLLLHACYIKFAFFKFCIKLVCYYIELYIFHLRVLLYENPSFSVELDTKLEPLMD